VIRARDPERPVPSVNKIHPALKLGAYAATTLLPGENPAHFEKLHRELIAELAPNGALEENIVSSIARWVWRKQNLATIRVAERSRYLAIRSARLPDNILGMLGDTDLAKSEQAMRAAEDEAREELGDRYRLVEIGETATFDGLEKDLGIEERLDGMIDRCLKRLLFLRGLKSISAASSSSAPQRRIAGPGRAA
jgi:hypothetical protein